MRLISTSNHRFLFFLLVMIIALLIIAGCGILTPQEQIEAQLYATLYARDHTIPPPKYQTLAAQYYGVTIPEAVITPTPVYSGPPTMSALEFGATQIAQQQSISMTQQANELELKREQMAAEARAAQQATAAYYAQATAQQRAIEATAYEDERRMIATANAQGTAMMYTAEAGATATTYRQIQDSNNTAVAAQATSQVLPTHAIWTLDAVYAQQTITAGEANKVQLAVRRQEMKNWADAYLPWMITVAAIGALGYGFGQYVKTRVHARDEHGRVPLLQVKADSGDTILVKPELMESSTMKIGRDGSVVRYAPIDAQEQSDINRRAQAVEAIASLPTPYAQSGAKIVTSEFSSARARVTITNPNAMGPALDEADRGLLEEIKND